MADKRKLTPHGPEPAPPVITALAAASSSPSEASGKAPGTVVNMAKHADGSVTRVRDVTAPSVKGHADVAQFLRDHGTHTRLCLSGSTKDTFRPEYCIDEVDHYLAEMKPSNPAERMLAVQMLWNHHRVSHLSVLAVQQTRLDTMRAIHHALDEAMNLARRQALAWSQIKAPRPVQIIRGDTVNMADKQVVGTVNMAGQSQPNRANEQGLSLHAPPRPASATEVPALEPVPPLPTVAGGPGIAPGRDCTHPPLGAEYWPAHG